MSERMRDLTLKFHEVLFIDATHKSNRFNLPLLDGAIINNFGKTCTSFWALIENQKQGSFEWALQQLKKHLKMDPKVIILDEEDALVNGKIISYY